MLRDCQSLKNSMNPGDSGARNAAVAAALMVAIWQGVVTISRLLEFILPPPVSVLDELRTNRLHIIEHSGVRLSEVLLGIFAGTVLGICTAVHLAYSVTARAYIRPILVFFR